jgi:hypothetical protein
MSTRGRHPLVTRWLRFEDRAFQVIARGERWVRGLPAGSRIVPATFDRLIFRLALAAAAAMVIIMAVPSRTFRIRALLLLLLALFVLVMGAAFADSRSNGRR